MDARSSSALSPDEKLVLLRQAFQEFRTRCFWFLRSDLVPEADRKFKAPFPTPLAPSSPAQRPDKLT